MSEHLKRQLRVMLEMLYDTMRDNERMERENRTLTEDLRKAMARIKRWEAGTIKPEGAEEQ